MIGGDFDQRTTAAGASADRVGIERAGDQVVFGGVSASLVSQCRSSHPFSISFLPLVNSSLCSFLTFELSRVRTNRKRIGPSYHFSILTARRPITALARRLQRLVMHSSCEVTSQTFIPAAICNVEQISYEPSTILTAKVVFVVSHKSTRSRVRSSYRLPWASG